MSRKNRNARHQSARPLNIRGIQMSMPGSNPEPQKKLHMVDEKCGYEFTRLSSIALESDVCQFGRGTKSRCRHHQLWDVCEHGHQFCDRGICCLYVNQGHEYGSGEVRGQGGKSRRGRCSDNQDVPVLLHGNPVGGYPLSALYGHLTQGTSEKVNFYTSSTPRCRRGVFLPHRPKASLSKHDLTAHILP